MNPLFFRDQTEGETPAIMYAIFRRFDRLWSAPYRAHLEDERADFYAALLSPRVQYLLHHLLRLKSRAHPENFDDVLARYPKLEALRTVEPIDHPIALSDNPRGSWGYLTNVGIYL